MLRRRRMRVVIVVPAFPKVSNATHQLLVDRSRVVKRRVPQECVAEFTSHVVCRPTTVRMKSPQQKWQSANGEQYGAQHIMGT